MKHKTPLIRKQTIGENVLYTLVFVAVYLIPIFNSFLMAEEHIDFYNKVFLAWSIITPYLVLFLFNNYILIRFLLNRGKIFWYVVSAFSVVIAVFTTIEFMERNLIISDGYNGTPSGFENICEDDMGQTKPYVLHAEANAITKVAKSANNCDGATLYITASPCLECSKLIIQAGIKRVVYGEKYRCEDGLELLKRVGIECVFVEY